MAKNPSKTARRALLALMALACCALFVARCTQLHPIGGEDGQGGDAAVQEQAAEQEAPETEQPAPADAQEAAMAASEGAMSERQLELIEGYDDSVKEKIDFLAGSNWQTYDSLKTCKFTTTSFTETDSTSEQTTSPVTYAVSAMETTAALRDGSTTESTMLVLECGDGKTRIVQLGKTTDAAGAVTYTISSGDFAGSDSYLRFEKAESVTCEGFSETMVRLIGGDTAPLDTAMTEWCRQFCPSATKAEWEQVVTVDEANGTVSFSMMLDSAQTPSVPVMYSASDGTFQVGRSR